MPRFSDNTAALVARFNARVPLAAQSALPSLRRAAEWHSQGSFIAGNTVRASVSPQGSIEAMLFVENGEGALYSRWWLRRRTLPLQTTSESGEMRWDGKGCTLAVRVGSGPASTKADLVVLSLGDITSMGLLTRLELLHVVLQPTPPTLAPYLLHPLPLKVLRVRHSQVELNELLTLMNTNAASLTKVEMSSIAVPTLQVFGLCPLLSELELQGASFGSARLGIGAPPEGQPTADESFRPFSDLASLKNLFRLDLSKCTQGLHLSGLRLCHSLRVINLSSSALSQENVADLGQLLDVTDLLLSKTRITDVQPLANCVRLAQLQLAGTLVTTGGLRGLGGLKNLRHLDLSNTPVDSVEELCSSKSLTTLILWKSRMTTHGLRGIEKVPTLEHLNVGDTAVEEAGFLAAAPSLRLLNIQNTLIASGGLEGCGKSTTLAELQAGNTLIDSAVQLGECLSLKKIDLYSARIDGAGIAQLANLKHMEELIVSNTDVDDARALASCTELRVLEMKHVKLPNSEALAGLEALPHLTKLLVTHCGVESVNAFGKSKTLQTLNLWSTKVTTEGIQGLREATSLEEVDLAETLVTDISSLLSCHQLRGLTLYSCPLTSVEGVEGLRLLRRLDLANTRISSISCLRKCLCLEMLNISDTQVDDNGFHGVGHIHSLKSVLLNNTPITSIGELGNCPHLEELHAGSSSVTGKGLVGIEKATNLQKLNLAYAKLGNEVQRLACLPHLKKLYLKGSGVAPSDIEYLQHYLSRCRISQDALQRRRKELTFFSPEGQLARTPNSAST